MPIGIIYPTPEIGWKRYNNTDSNFGYSTGWIYAEVINAVDDDYMITQEQGETVKFNFTGTSIRIIDGVNNNLSEDISINVDGVEYSYSLLNSTLVWAKCVFELTNLEDREHRVIITTKSSIYTVFDAIDLPINSELKPYREKIDKTLILHDGEYKKWNEGSYEEKKFPQEKLNNSYSNSEVSVSSSIDGLDNGSSPKNSYCVLDGKKALGDELWFTYIAPPDGVSHWIKVSFSEKKIINKFELTPCHYSGGEPALRTFSLYASNDDVEYKKILEGTFLKSSYDTEVYAFDNTTPYKYYKLSDLKSSSGGYNLVGISEIVFIGYDVNNSDNLNKWVKKNDFLSEGMDSLSPLLDRRVETLEPLPMTETSATLPAGGTGKVFTKTIDLKKYIDIRSITVEVE